MLESNNSQQSGGGDMHSLKPKIQQIRVENKVKREREREKELRDVEHIPSPKMPREAALLSSVTSRL